MRYAVAVLVPFLLWSGARAEEKSFDSDGVRVAYFDEGETPLRAGSCFHLAPGQMHIIENSGPGSMRILGVFHPSGSPADRNG